MSSYLNGWTFSGFVKGAPKSGETGGGKKYASAFIEQTDGVKTKDGGTYSPKVRITGWGYEADAVGKLRDGDFVIVVGEPKADAYTDKDGKARASLECSVRAITIVSAQNPGGETLGGTPSEEAPSTETKPKARAQRKEASKNTDLVDAAGNPDDDLPF